MKLRKHNIFPFSTSTIILLVLFGLIGVKHVKSESIKDKSQKLLEAASEELGVPVTSLEIINEGTLHLQYLDQDFPTAKVRDLKTDMIYAVTLDSKGQRVQKDSLLAQDLDIKKARYGKFEPGLHSLLQTLNPSDTVEVTLWMVAPDDPLERPTPEEIETKGEALIESIMEERAQQKKSRLAALQQPLLKQLQAMNAEIRDVNGLAPIISARLSRNQIEAIANRPDVEGVYLSRENRPMLDTSVPTVTAPAVWSRGFTGLNRSIAIIEQGGIEYVSSPGIGLRVTNRLGTCNEADNYHSTQVAGVAVSNDITYRGVAYDAYLLGADTCDPSYSDSSLQAATTWARDNGGKIHNNSWGDNTDGYPSNMSRFHDTVVRDWGVTVVDAAGNCVGGCQVIAPALAYNVIAVGSFFDRNTPTWDDPWNEDRMSSWSSYENPSSGHGDREKPEVAAPGEEITTSYPYGFYTNSGTSFSAPHVAGGAALIMQRMGDNFRTRDRVISQYWPEGVKAILMATAVHNLEGASRLSDFDGTGGISLDHADVVASSGNHAIRPLRGGIWFPVGSSINYSFAATAGQVVRAVIAWDSSSNYSYYDNQPSVDLDLFVYRPSGSEVARSVSWDNTYEIVEFAAPETGTYRLQVYNQRFNDLITFLGVAWKN